SAARLSGSLRRGGGARRRRRGSGRHSPEGNEKIENSRPYFRSRGLTNIDPGIIVSIVTPKGSAVNELSLLTGYAYTPLDVRTILTVRSRIDRSSQKLQFAM